MGYIPLTNLKHETRFVKLMLLHLRATELIERGILDMGRGGKENIRKKRGRIKIEAREVKK